MCYCTDTTQRSFTQVTEKNRLQAEKFCRLVVYCGSMSTVTDSIKHRDMQVTH